MASTAPQFSQAPQERHVSIDEGRTGRPSAIKKNAAPTERVSRRVRELSQLNGAVDGNNN